MILIDVNDLFLF